MGGRIAVESVAGMVWNTHIIVELKSVEAVQPVHKKQLLTYLRLANKELGLLINFGELLLKRGIHRIINSPKPHSVNRVGSSDPEVDEGEPR
jgi:GxxExxY protein